jgi:hypothetical protein
MGILHECPRRSHRNRSRSVLHEDEDAYDDIQRENAADGLVVSTLFFLAPESDAKSHHWSGVTCWSSVQRQLCKALM